MDNNLIELSEKQAEYVKNANHRWNGKVGATQSGKTYIDTLFVIPDRIIDRLDKKGLVFIVGVSKETIQRNIIEPLQELYGSKVVTNIGSNNTSYMFGQKVYCIGADNVGRVRKFRGPRVKYLYIDEVYDINREVFELLKSRLSFEYSKCDFAGNPQTPTHWFEKFINSNFDIYYQRYQLFDNPFLPENYKTELCKEYEGTVYYNRYILGQSCNADGIIFTPIANNKQRYMTNININGIISIGIDWGGNKSKHSITATRMRRDYCKIQVLRSETMTAKGTDTNDIFNWIIKFIKDIMSEYGGISAIFCDSAEQVLNNSLFSELRRNALHIPIYDSLKTEIKDRIEAIIRLMNTDRISFIENKTDTVVFALQSAIYDDKAPTDRWIDDGETSDIDSLDSFVYSWSKWLNEIMAYRGVIQ
jgi:PBSX family phage terminase large subunit